MGILQARILELVAMPSSRGSSQPRDRTQVSHIAGRFFPEPLGKPKEGWAPKNWCFWTVVKTLESPLDCMEVKLVNSKGNQSWVFLGLMLKVKLQYFGRMMWRADSSEKTLILGNIEGRRRRGRQRMRWLDGITDPMDISLSILRRWWRTEKPGVLQSLGSQRVGHAWMNDWTTSTTMYVCIQSTCLQIGL